MSPLRLVVIDDHPAILLGVAAALSDAFEEAHIEPCSSAASAAAHPEGFDVAVLDPVLSDGSVAADNVGLLRARGYGVVIYAQDKRRSVVAACFEAGASGIVSKSDRFEMLVEAVRRALDGETYLTEEWSAALQAEADTIPHLTPRESDALSLYSTGLPLKSVARRMNVAEQTAREYLLRARRKYSQVGRPADTRTDLYIRAVEDGRLPGPRPL